jgi:hypothetical protein
MFRPYVDPNVQSLVLKSAMSNTNVKKETALWRALKTILSHIVTFGALFTLRKQMRSVSMKKFYFTIFGLPGSLRLTTIFFIHTIKIDDT